MAEMSDFTFWVTVIIFTVTILAVVSGKIDSSVAAVLGVLAMVWIGTMTEGQAFNAVQQNGVALRMVGGKLPPVADEFRFPSHP